VREEGPSIYDRIGVDYSNLRQPDPRIAAPILAALGAAGSVLNVGAGTGSYEPADRPVTAIEPSAEMIRQRKPSAAPAVQGHAEALPFPDKAFDAAMAILTVHHWTDKAQGLKEMRRVARGPVIVLTFDPAHRGTWLTDISPSFPRWTRRRCRRGRNTSAGWGRSRSARCQCRRIAATAFSMPIGAGRKPISIPGSGGGFRRSGHCPIWMGDSPA